MGWGKGRENSTDSWMTEMRRSFHSVMDACPLMRGEEDVLRGRLFEGRLRRPIGVKGRKKNGKNEEVREFPVRAGVVFTRGGFLGKEPARCHPFASLGAGSERFKKPARVSTSAHTNLMICLQKTCPCKSRLYGYEVAPQAYR